MGDRVLWLDVSVQLDILEHSANVLLVQGWERKVENVLDVASVCQEPASAIMDILESHVRLWSVLVIVLERECVTSMARACVNQDSLELLVKRGNAPCQV